MTHSFNKSAAHAQLYSKAYSPQAVRAEVRVIRSIPTHEIILGSSDPMQCFNPVVPAEVRLDGGDDRERRDIEQNTESLQKDGNK